MVTRCGRRGRSREKGWVPDTLMRPRGRVPGVAVQTLRWTVALRTLRIARLVSFPRGPRVPSRPDSAGRFRAPRRRLGSARRACRSRAHGSTALAHRCPGAALGPGRRSCSGWMVPSQVAGVDARGRRDAQPCAHLRICALPAAAPISPRALRAAMLASRRMAFAVGKRVVAESESIARSPRSGVVEEVLRGDPSPRYRIRWDDGHQSIYTPASGALRAEPRPKRNAPRLPRNANRPEI